MAKIAVFLADGIYIPIKYVTEEHREQIVERYERHVYDKEKVCEQCEYFGERPSDVCTGCPNYKGLFKMHREEEFKGRECLRLPYGDRVGIKKIFGSDLNVIDKTPEPKMKRPFEMSIKMYDYQIPAVKKMLKTRSGILKSNPRTGKTVMAAAYIAKKGLKTIILASQRDWLDNFMETFIGSDTQPAMTTIRKKRIGFAKKFEDFEKYDVCLSTYQTFLSPGGKKLLHKIRNMFGVLVLDEVQYAAALQFSKVLGTFNCRHKFGLSGTPTRKDTLHSVTYKLMGGIFYETEVPRLRPRIEVVETQLSGKLPQTWVYAVSKIEKDPVRLKLIAKTAIRDAKAGHIVLIPMSRVPVVKALKQAINIMADRNIAEEFHGGTPKDMRKKIIDRVRNRKIKILVGNSRLLSTGINIPSASMLYQCTPSSNMQKAEQRFSRVLTPMTGKLQPVVKYFLDNVDVVRHCMRAEHFGCLWPMFKPMIDGRTKMKLDNYFKNKKEVDHGDGFSGGYL